MRTTQQIQDILLKEQRVNFFDEYGYIPSNEELFELEVMENEI